MDITEEKLIDELKLLIPDYAGEKILVAVSGGVDSMVCAYILKKFNYNIIVAHCNFQLRKKDSDNDAAFVKKWAARNKVPYLEKKFRLKKQKGSSVQMQARDLRYQWFDEMAIHQKAVYIITAHNLNDSIETSLMNMIRGSGINGITGIPAVNGKILRPMTRIFRKEIEAYAKSEKIKWREDKTNKTTKYKRNKIRHELIPVLQEFNPNFLEVFAANLENWQNVSRIYRQSLSRLKTELIHFDEALMGFKISVLELIGRGINTEIMFELVSEFGFNADQAEQIIQAMHHQPGKKFFSKDHVLLIDRLFIMIRPFEQDEAEEEELKINDDLPFENRDWEIKLVESKKLATLHTSQKEILLDYKLLKWPITIRPWKNGDRFTPMGMKGKKKVSDFLTDIKMDRFRKEDARLVISGKSKVAGIIGLRPDENFKISKNTKLCLYIKRKSLYF